MIVNNIHCETMRSCTQSSKGGINHPIYQIFLLSFQPEPTEAVDEEEVLETGDQQEKNEEEEAEEAGDNPPMEMEDQIIEEV